MVEYKSLKIHLSSWNKLRRVFYGRKDETFSDYIERISIYINQASGDIKLAKNYFEELKK